MLYHNAKGAFMMEGDESDHDSMLSRRAVITQSPLWGGSTGEFELL